MAQKFDLVVDMRNSFLGLILPGLMRCWGAPRNGLAYPHMKDRHYQVIRRLGIPRDQAPRVSFQVSAAERKATDALLEASAF